MSRRFLNGETRLSKPQPLHVESIGMQGEPGELKHLSTRRKRKKIDFLSSGERKGKSPNRPACGAGLWTAQVSNSSYELVEARRRVLGKPARESESLVFESGRQRQNPEYHETRETLWEAGGTTPQG